MAEWNQGFYKPINPSKCMNPTLPYYRSNYERKFMQYLDNNTNILRWNSEMIKIPYRYTLDNKIHSYTPDFYVESTTTNGKSVKYLIEVKDTNETPMLNERNELIAPPQPKKKTAKSMKNYVYHLRVLEKNRCKWIAAKEYCRQNGMIFKVISEKDLFG